MENKTLIFESKKNSVDVLLNDDFMSIASIDIMHEDEELEDCNRNMVHFSHESIVKSIPTFYNRPIVYRLNKANENFAIDVTSHAKNEKDWNEMQIAGHIPTDSRITFHKADNGKIYCNVESIIQKRYIPLLMRVLEERDGRMDVSIEIEPTDYYQDEDTGILYINEFKLLGVCMLGEGVEPGMEGSHLEMLTFELNDDFDELNRKYIKFSYDNNNIIEKIKYKKANFEKGGIMEHRELERKLWQVLSHETFSRGKELMQKYYIEAIYDTHIIVHDNEKGEYFKMKYHIDKDGNVEVDMKSAKPLEDDLKRFELAEKSFAKEDIGTKEALKIDKKELKETPWGQIDKAELRKRVIEAKNFKTIAPEVFLDLREGWEEGKMGALKYPVMEIENDTLYYNRGALASAKGYAEKNNEEEVLAKLKKIYEKFNLEFEDKENDSKVMMSCEGSEEIHNECGEGEIIKNEAEHGEDCDCEECKEKFAKEPKDEINEPHAGAQKDKDEKDAKDDEEVRKDDVKDEIKMSTDANVDAPAAVEIEKKQAEDNKELANEQNTSLDELKEENKKLVEEMTKLNEEIVSLREFKKQTEEETKKQIVDGLIFEVKEIIPENVLTDLIESAKNYELHNINEWQNIVKAKAFEYTGKVKTNTNKNYTRMGIWGNVKNIENKPKSQWDF